MTEKRFKNSDDKNRNKDTCDTTAPFFNKIIFPMSDKVPAHPKRRK